MVWAQIFPFVALEFFEGEKKEELRAFLTTSCVSWIILNVVFFATVNSAHIHTFFTTKTASTQSLLPTHYNFFPRTYMLPLEYKDFREDSLCAKTTPVYILKPENSCQG